MPTILELYGDAIKYEESTLAHYILLLLQEGKASLDDDDSIIGKVHVDNEKLELMIENNYLGFSKVNIYSIKYTSNTFAFIYAESKQEAKMFFFLKTGQQPLNCNELSPDETMAVGNRFINFRDWRKEQREFPCMVGVYERGY